MLITSGVVPGGGGNCPHPKFWGNGKLSENLVLVGKILVQKFSGKFREKIEF